ncbi:MAG: hypothetical protein LBH57_00785 [Treponema sp.]|jgi:hypothetical protein|nr:hypothetical protein [Treponema sp.]
MKMIVSLRTIPKIVFLILVFSLCGCIHTKSGNTNFNRDIEIAAVSGNVYISISGHISEDIYTSNQINYDEKGNINIGNSTMETRIVEQGKETINKKIILNETQRFRYTLTTAEVVIMNLRSVDGNDVKIIVSEYGKNKEYIIEGKSQIGKMISFRN